MCIIIYYYMLYSTWSRSTYVVLLVIQQILTSYVGERQELFLKIFLFLHLACSKGLYCIRVNPLKAENDGNQSLGNIQLEIMYLFIF